MDYTVNFGRLASVPRASPGPRFRVALMGDFSGRGSRLDVPSVADLAGRKALDISVDNFDDVLARLSPRVAVELGDGGAFEITIASMDDFHPDQLVEAVPLLAELMQLRRNLMSRAGFAAASREVLGWAGAEPLARTPRRRRDGALATDRRLSDFARLTGRKRPAEASVDDLVRRLVGPYVVPATDSRQEALVARVDAALAEAMRRVLHSPGFQAAEALWRGAELLARRLETGARLQIVLYDITAEELAADLAAHDDLAESSLHRLLVEQPAMDGDAGPLSFIAALYGFELSPPHADVLGRLAQVAAAAGAPAVVAAGPDALVAPEHEWHPMVRSAWSALRAHPAAPYLGVASPRFLLRMPYGRRTDPVDAFAFEEFTRQGGLSGMLWGHPALLLAWSAGQSWLRGGKAMTLGGEAVIGELPVYVYHDQDGDQVALPCTERLFTERVAAQVSAVGVMPIVSLRGRPEVRIASFGSVAGRGLAGVWAPHEVKAPVPPPPPPAVAMQPPPVLPPPAAVVPQQAVVPQPAAVAATAPEAQPEPEPQPTEPAAGPEAAAASDAGADLDALLAEMSAAAEAETNAEVEPDLDALLAALK